MGRSDILSYSGADEGGTRVVVIPREPIIVHSFRDGDNLGSRMTTENIVLAIVGFSPRVTIYDEGTKMTGLTAKDAEGYQEACGFDVKEHKFAIVTEQKAAAPEVT